MHRRGMMGCAGVVVCFLVLAAGISAENKQAPETMVRSNSFWDTMPIDESKYKNYISVQLVKKGWKPKLTKMPNYEELLPEYPGTVEDVFKTFIDNNNMYESEERTLKNFADLLTENYGYKSNKESIFFIRPAKKPILRKNTVLAMAMRNMEKHYNLFTIVLHDFTWTVVKAIITQTVTEDNIFPAVGKTIGEHFDAAIEKNLIQPNQIHVFGLCFAGRIGGHFAQYIYNKHNKKIKSVLALDPFSLGVASSSPNVLLADDAEIVQVYHTNSIIMGTPVRKANIDIVFNSGQIQPGCENLLELGCSHERSIKVLWYIILYPSKFLARKCDSWSDFENCRCEDEIITLTYPPDTTKQGVFFLKTLSEKPYGLGVKGSDCPKNVDEEVDVVENREVGEDTVEEIDD